MRAQLGLCSETRAAGVDKHLLEESAGLHLSSGHALQVPLGWQRKQLQCLPPARCVANVLL